LDKQVFISLGVVVTRPRAPVARARRRWQPSGVMLGDTPAAAGRLLRRDGKSEYFSAGAAELRLTANEIESYRVNLSQPVPQLYLVMARQSADDTPPLIHHITADRDEADGMRTSTPAVIDEVPMPLALADLISIFIDSHAEEDGDEADLSEQTATLH
jgi:hypothetical protein